jgi:hypothetical protein
MAYTQDYSMGGYIPGDYETEEERRRRLLEEQAQAQAQDQENGISQQPAAGGGVDLAGLAKNFIGNRSISLGPQEPPVAQAPVVQPDAANTEVQSQQVKTYADGSQEHVVKTQTPAPVAPVQATQAPAVTEAPVQAAPVAQAPVAQAPVAQTQPGVLPARPVSPEEQAQQEAMVRAVQQPQNQPTPGPATQFAGPATASAMNQPFTGQGIKMPTATTAANLQQVAEQMQQAPTFETRFTSASKDVGLLDQLRKDESLTKEQKLLAGRQMQQLLNQELGQVRGKEELANLTDVEMARILKSKSEEGSYAKLLLLGFVSPTLAAKEAAKLGLNDQWTIGTNDAGNSVLLKTRDGVPIEGYNPTTNKQLSAKELINTAGTTPGKLKPDVSTQDVEKEGRAGRVVTTYDQQNRPKTMVESGGKMYPYDTTWRPRAIATAAAKAEQGKQISLAYDPLIEAAKKGAGYLGEFNAKHGTNFGIAGTGAGGAPIIVDNNTNTVVKKNDQGVVTAVTNAGAGNVGLQGLGNGRGNTPAQIEQNMALNKKQGEANIELNKETKAERGKVAAKDIDAKLNQLNETQYVAQRGIDAIDENKHLFGGGTNAVARAYYTANPLATESDEYRITKDVMKLAQQENLTNLVSLMKGSLSDKDLEYVRKNQINEKSSPAQIRTWLEHYRKATEKAYQNQANVVNQPGAPVDTGTVTPTATKRYNPATGKVEIIQ